MSWTVLPFIRPFLDAGEVLLAVQSENVLAVGLDSDPGRCWLHLVDGVAWECALGPREVGARLGIPSLAIAVLLDEAPPKPLPERNPKPWS